MATRKKARAKKRPAPPRYSAAQKIEHVIARGEVSARALAKKLRVKESTFRNRRRGVGELTEAQARKLTKLAAEARAQTRQDARREGIAPPKGTAIPTPTRRLQKRTEPARPVKRGAAVKPGKRPRGPAPPARVPGEILEASLEGLSRGAMFDVLWPYREQALQRAKRTRGSPGMFRFVMRERTHRKLKPERGKAAGGPRNSAYVRALMRDKERAEHRKPSHDRRQVKPVYMTRPMFWDGVLSDDELRDAIAEAERGGLGGGGWPAVVLAVRIYPPGV
jgi:hypothetical protein